MTTIEGFLTDVITNVDAYWTETFAANGLPEPRVAYAWVPPGRVIATGCGAPADDNAAFYCPADDTIYVALRFATAIYEGTIRGLPGEAEGGRAIGDFGVAYVIAHEYAHNLQEELGIFTLGGANSTKPFELQADCMAGAWGSSAFASGRYTAEDIEEAVSTAVAVGDFDVSGANHHGTPQERRAAWLDGFEAGDPSVCARYGRAMIDSTTPHGPRGTSSSPSGRRRPGRRRRPRAAGRRGSRGRPGRGRRRSGPRRGARSGARASRRPAPA